MLVAQYRNMIVYCVQETHKKSVSCEISGYSDTVQSQTNNPLHNSIEDSASSENYQPPPTLQQFNHTHSFIWR